MAKRYFHDEYMCNGCGGIFDDFTDAAKCCADVITINPSETRHSQHDDWLLVQKSANAESRPTTSQPDLADGRAKDECYICNQMPCECQPLRSQAGY